VVVGTCGIGMTEDGDWASGMLVEPDIVHPPAGDRHERTADGVELTRRGRSDQEPSIFRRVVGAGHATPGGAVDRTVLLVVVSSHGPPSIWITFVNRRSRRPSTCYRIEIPRWQTRVPRRRFRRMKAAQTHGTKTGNAIGRPRRGFNRDEVVRL